MMNFKQHTCVVIHIFSLKYFSLKTVNMDVIYPNEYDDNKC